MSPESGMLDELRFELRGRQVVAYLSRSPTLTGGVGNAPPPTRWKISLDGGPGFDGPIYRGYLQSEATEALAELRAYLEGHLRFRESE